MLTSNLNHHDKTWPVYFVRSAVVLATLILTSLLVFVGSTVQAPV